MYGGAMRQAGILAAAGLYALDYHVARLKDDHDHAKKLARGLAQIPAVRIAAHQVETNIVIFEIPEHRHTPAELVVRLKAEGLLIHTIGGRRFRAVTHLDVTTAQIDEAISIFNRVIGS